MKDLLVLFRVDSKFLPHLCLLDRFFTDPVATVIRATGHQMVSLCRSACEEEKNICCLPWWIVSISCLDLVQQFSCLVYNIRLYVDRTEWGAGQAEAGAIAKSTDSWDIGNHQRWDRHQRKAPKNSVHGNFPHEESVRRNWVWRVLRDRIIRRCQYAKPFWLSGMPEECLRALIWASWSDAAFPRQSSFCPWSAVASGKTWVARAGFPRKAIERGKYGAAEGEDQEGLPCGAWPWASVCGGLDHRWSWCCWPAVASPDKSVLLGGCAEDGRQLWSCWEAVGAVCANH